MNLPHLSEESNLIPKEILFGNPEKSSPRISPDGLKLAYLAPHKNVMNIYVNDFTTGKVEVVTKDKDRGISGYYWHYDSLHLFYIQDIKGNENWQLYRTNIETKKTVCLTPFADVQVQILDKSKHYPNKLIISMNKDNPELHDVYELNVLNGQIDLLEKNPGNYTDWITNFHLEIKGALASREDGGFDLLIKNETGDFEVFYNWNSDDSANSGPFFISKDNQYIYMLDSTNSNTTKFIKMSLNNKSQDIIYQDPVYDVSWAIVHPDTLEIQLIALTKDRDHYIIFDESIKDDIERIKRVHSEGDFFIANRNLADDVWLVGYTRDCGAVPYYRYDRKFKEFSFLFYHQSQVNKYELASLEPISFVSRDGLTLHGYISFPLKVERRHLPLVLNVHGGPWSRDYYGFDPEVHLFTNRGYICLQVNYRGSTGYGKDFTNAGDHEWGGKMLDDLIDACHWAIDQGYADQKRIAIYGGSYGGYAALAASTFTKNTFCCAVDIVGPSNLITFINSVPEYWKPFLAMLHRRIGDPDTEGEFLKSRSPLFHVDNIKIPLLIAQGAHDPRVKQEESEQIVEVLKKKKIFHKYLLFEDEGHGFVKPENRLKFYTEVEEFLSKFLGGKKEQL